MRVVENSVISEVHSAQGFLDRMQFFYELFPYPNRPLFLRPDPEGSIETHAGYSKILAEKGASLTAEALEDIQLRDVRHAFPKDKKIALVGCGTDEPLLFRVLHPYNPLVGIDLSLKSLERAQRKLNWHRLRPARLIHGDACFALPEEGPFAHIQCFGVLHHQPNPRKMLAAMAQNLEKNGTLRLMIYSRTGRRLERGVQKKFISLWSRVEQKLQGKIETHPTRSTAWALSWASLKLFLWRITLPFFAPKTLAARFRYIGISRARIADAFLHPSDHPLNLAELLIWASQEGLELVSHRAQSYDLGQLASHSNSPVPIGTLVSEEERGNISSNIVLVFKKVGAGTWTTK